jgi:signal transduction histidine kinase
LVSRRRLLLDIRERVASIIHGQIQGRLSGIALALRLQDPSATDLKKEEEISNLLALVENELRSILQTVHHENELTFVSGIEEIRREWESIVNIDVQIQLESEFNPSQNVIRNVRLALNEAISNAVRHGRAKNIEIVITRYKHTKENLHLSISNDGQPLADAREPGLGFRNLDATPADWKISNTESGQVCVEAII